MRILLALVLCCGLGNSAAAQSELYQLKPGDTIDVSVWQDPKLNRQLVISPDNTISFPLVGHIQAGGLTPQALENTLKKKLQPNYQTPLNVTVSLVSVTKEDTDSRIFVTGEVNRPGTYPLQPGTNVLQAIALSGGLAPFAAKSRIQIHRQVNGVQEVYVFNYSAFESGKNLDGNIDLRPGDVVVVPERGIFR